MTYNPASDTFAAPGRRPSLHDQWREVSARIDAEDALRATGDVDPASFLAIAAPPTDAAGRYLRHDGWTPDRQRAFLSAIADGDTVERACRLVGLSVASAYAFRKRAAGAGFALGWRAANLLARDRVADQLMARALDGQVETVTRPDGSTIARHRYDNRTALTLLARLDRMVEQAPADPAAAASSHAARLIAQDFEAFLDLIEADEGPARAGLFLARRTGLAGAPQAAPALEPVLALARADLFTRTGASLPEEVDTADLDLTQRATWTGDQWLRAEAAGLLRVAAPPEEKAPVPQLPQLVPEPVGIEPVAWDYDAGEYRTHLPPPEGEEPDFERGEYGDEMYERGLTDSEQALMDRLDALATAEQRLAESAERDEWFARIEAEIAEAEGQGGGEGGDADSSFPVPREPCSPATSTPCFPGESRGPVPDHAIEDVGSAPQDDAETPHIVEAELHPEADTAVNAV